MMCAGLLLAIVLAAAVPNPPDAARSSPDARIPTVAAPRDVVAKPIDLSVAGAIHHPATLPSRDTVEPSGPDSWGADRPGISVGPLRTEFGGITGHHLHLATMKLEGVTFLGASVGGSIDSRSARITFSWPTVR